MNKDLLEKTEAIVREAAKLTHTERVEIKDKGTLANIVTSTDLNVQKFLIRELANLIPGSTFYCEEEGMQDKSGEYIWVIDPIDGTMNYSRGLNDFCISVGLVHNKEIYMGIVYLPAKDEMFTAMDGLGSFLNGKAIHVSDRPFNEALLCTAACTYRKEYAKVCFDIIQDVYYSLNDIRRIGTCAMEVCYIACGKVEMFFEMRIMPWDYAGAWAILKNAGGYLCGLNGEKLTFDKPTVLIGANSEENLNKLSSSVSKFIKEIPNGYYNA